LRFRKLGTLSERRLIEGSMVCSRSGNGEASIDLGRGLCRSNMTTIANVVVGQSIV
jgi:hypothetical protein